jgi:uncharacterized protein YjaG (DUF416 family)
MEIKLEELSIYHQIMLASSVCERILPSYISVNFQENFNHETFPVLREILNYIWELPISENFDEKKLRGFLNTCHEIKSEIQRGLCDTAHYTAPYSLYNTLELCLSKN